MGPVGARGGVIRGRGGFGRGANLPVRPARNMTSQATRPNGIPATTATTKSDATTPTTAPPSGSQNPEAPTAADDPIAVEKTGE